MTERPEQRPEGRLIAAASKSSPLSVREAAAEVGMSEGRWYQIVRGYQTISKGVYAPVRGPAETLARMAKVVGVTPEQLEEAGRDDAAEELRALQPHTHGAGPASPVEESLRDKLARAHDLIAEGNRILEELRHEDRP